jgi:hypothetical protein
MDNLKNDKMERSSKCDCTTRCPCNPCACNDCNC